MEERLPRKLAAILYADVAGYSRLTGEDEEGTHRRLSQYLDHISGEIKHHQGRVVHYAGDAVLADFPTATDALACAVSVQEELETRNQDLPLQKRVEFRIGINLGEVIVDRDDIYGDGVNVAARLESLAHPGGICISESVRAAIGKKLSVDYKYLGEQQVKNIAEPVRAYHVLSAHDQPVHGVPHSKEVTRSVAVLPFVNMSGDQEQEYFSDGLTEDIITSLSVWRSFPVVSRNSTFTYKNRNIQPQQIAVELGARYILEGSVRKSGKRVRITAELIDGETGHNLWAQSFDRDLEDIFAVQDEITHRISATVVPEFEQTETKRSISKSPNNLNTWDYYLRGLSFVHKSTKEGNTRAHEMFRKALELEPDYGPALSGIAYVLNRDLLLDNVESFEKTANECLEAAKRAVDLDESAAISRTELVRALLWCGQHDAAIQEATRAVELNPANALAQGWLGAALCFAGREEEGIPRLENAIELAPRDPRNKFFMTHLALAHLTTGQLERALNYARSAIQGHTDFVEAPAVLASTLAHLDKKEEAQRILSQFGIRSISSIENRPFWRRYLYLKSKNLVLEGLLKADLDWQEAQVAAIVSLQQPDKPSIAVLPFTNMSGDPEQEYFSDGITEDIITELSRFRSLFVIARNSSFTYKSPKVDIKHVGRELGVQYLVEGSVRKADKRIRITAQLVETANGNHIWAERYDRELEDIFSVQDEVAQTVVSILPGRLDDAAFERTKRKPTESMTAYDYVLRGIKTFKHMTHENCVEAGQMFTNAIDLDPGYARAYTLLANTYIWTAFMEWSTKDVLDKAMECCEKALSLDDNDSRAHAGVGLIMFLRKQDEESENHFQRAMMLNPNDPDVAAFRADVLVYLGRWDEALDWINKAKRLNPFHPEYYDWYRALVLYSAHEYEQAVKAIKEMMNLDRWHHAYLAACYAHMNRLDDAHSQIAEFVDAIQKEHKERGEAAHPVTLTSASERANRYRNLSDREHFLDGLRKAGLPE